VARQQYIPVLAVIFGDIWSADNSIAGGFGQIPQLVGLEGPIVRGMDFLQADDVGMEVFQDSGDPRGIAAPINADTLMDVVAHH
jgi:hypothetical protein